MIDGLPLDKEEKMRLKLDADVQDVESEEIQNEE
jgi:hypothetical protein